MRVLHVIPSVALKEGGPSVAIRLMEHGLASAGVEVTTLTTDDGFERPLAEDDAVGEPMGQAGFTRIYQRKWLECYKVAPGMMPWLGMCVRSFDVVHVHALFSFAPIVAATAALGNRVPYIVRPLGTLSAYGMSRRRQRLKALSLRIIEAPLLRRASAVHFTSDIELSEAAKLGLEFQGVVIPIGIATNEVNRAARATRSLGAPVNVLFLSRVHPKKNLEALIDAFAGETNLRRTATLTIAGSGEEAYVETLKARVRATGLSSVVTWMGHVEGARKAHVLAAADIYVLPSHSENFGIAAAEAMLAGLPCVLSPGVAIAHAASSAGACTVAGPDSKSLASALERLVRDSDQCLQMSLAARSHATREYSVESMSRRLISLYEAVLRRRRTI